MSQSGEVCIGDLGVTWQEQRAAVRRARREHFSTGLSRESFDHLVLAQQGDRGDGGALVYVFDTPDGSLLYQDTSGHWSGILRDLRPDVAIVAAAGRGNIDGEPIQGSLAEFVAREVELLGAERVVLSHHDNWLPGFSVDTDLTPIRDELARVGPRRSCSSSATSTGPRSCPEAAQSGRSGSTIDRVSGQHRVRRDPRSQLAPRHEVGAARPPRRRT